MTAELAVDRDNMDQSATHLELLPEGTPELSPIVDLYPKVDPMQITREDFLGLPDGQSRRDILVSLCRNRYDPAQVEQAQRLFYEGFSSPLSPIERRVFGAMERIMNDTDIAVLDQDVRTLDEYLHDISIDQAIILLRQEGANRREGHFWATRGDIGGYQLNREIAFEVERQADIENDLDKAKMHSLEDMARQLARRDLQIREADRTEMERLREEYEHREQAREAFLKTEREKGYRNLRVH